MNRNTGNTILKLSANLHEAMVVSWHARSAFYVSAYSKPRLQMMRIRIGIPRSKINHEIMPSADQIHDTKRYTC